jgi:sulfate transporter 4
VPVGSTDGIKVDWCHQIKAIAKIVFHNFRFGGGDLKANKSVEDWIGAFLPCWMWLRVYAWKSNLWRDVVAGLTVGIMVIPQAMSYAKLAGLPVQYGLYSALVPLYVYAVFGSSRHLAVGPVAITSLLLSAALTKVMERKGIAVDDPTYDSTYIQLAIQTSFLVAALYIGMALFRLGFITLFLSHGVVSGFTSGAAIVSTYFFAPLNFGRIGQNHSS